jgi:hypothetical protein
MVIFTVPEVITRSPMANEATDGFGHICSGVIQRVAKHFDVGNKQEGSGLKNELMTGNII